MGHSLPRDHRMEAKGGEAARRGRALPRIAFRLSAYHCCDQVPSLLRTRSFQKYAVCSASGAPA